jgi:hypothetical protein
MKGINPSGLEVRCFKCKGNRRWVEGFLVLLPEVEA